MKHLLALIMCAVLGTSAYANNVSPKKELPAKQIEVTINLDKNENKKSKAFRRQMCFTYHDACGQTLTVYVSGGSSTHYLLFESVADNYFLDHLGSDFCFK
jgi:hypothetical protein